jgi:hypothetical protein
MLRTVAGGDCDLVTPQSTIKGKGYWGSVEGLELQLNLSDAGHAFVDSPLNYRRVQVGPSRRCFRACFVGTSA